MAVPAALVAIDHFGFWKHADRLTAAGTVVAAIAAIFIGFKAARIAQSQRQLASMEILRAAYGEFFKKEELRRVRRHFIESYQANQVDEALARIILNYFEDIALYVRRGFVDARITYELLSPWIIHYWYPSKAFVDQIRQELKHPEYWCGLEGIVEQFQGFARKDSRRFWPGFKWLNGFWRWVTGFDHTEPYTRPPTPDETSLFFEREIAELDALADIAAVPPRPVLNRSSTSSETPGNAR